MVRLVCDWLYSVYFSFYLLVLYMMSVYIYIYICVCVCVCAEGQRRTAKSPTVPGQTAKPSKPGEMAANQTGSGTSAAANEQLASDVERNVMLEQQREHLQAQLALQRQLHNELQQHLKLQHEHHQLQAQLMVSSINQLSPVFPQQINIPLI